MRAVAVRTDGETWLLTVKWPGNTYMSQREEGAAWARANEGKEAEMRPG